MFDAFVMTRLLEERGDDEESRDERAFDDDGDTSAASAGLWV